MNLGNGWGGLWGGEGVGGANEKKPLAAFAASGFFGCDSLLAAGALRPGASGLPGLVARAWLCLMDQAKFAAPRLAQLLSARSMVPMAVTAMSAAAVPSTIWYTVPTLVVAS